MSMLESVPSADVVITDSDYCAVALKYSKKEIEENTPPLVLAMGRDIMEKRITEIARENDVPIYENKSLAQKLYAVCQIGVPIPGRDEKLLLSVAEVLLDAYKTKNISYVCGENCPHFLYRNCQKNKECPMTGMPYYCKYLAEDT